MEEKKRHPWLRRKKEEPQEEKDPNQKEYPLFANMAYIMKGAFRSQKTLAVFLLLEVIASVAGTYLPTFALSAGIARITAGAEFEQLLRTVLVFFAAMLIAAVVQSWCNANIWWRLIDARVRFMMLRIHKVLYMDYEYIESAKVMEACQKAMRATGGNTNGVEGMMRSFWTLMSVLFSGLTAVVIVSRLSPWIIVLLLLLGVFNFWNMDCANCSPAAGSPSDQNAV